MKIKTLSAIVSAFTLSNCGASNIQELQGQASPYEETEVEVNSLYLDDGTVCQNADVTMSMDNYIIMCDENHYFLHHLNGTDTLVWDNQAYHDLGRNGDVDEMIQDRERTQSYTFVNDSNVDSHYARIILGLHVEQVQALWEKRWHRE